MRVREKAQWYNKVIDTSYIVLFLIVLHGIYAKYFTQDKSMTVDSTTQNIPAQAEQQPASNNGGAVLQSVPGPESFSSVQPSVSVPQVAPAQQPTQGVQGQTNAPVQPLAQNQSFQIVPLPSQGQTQSYQIVQAPQQNPVAPQAQAQNQQFNMQGFHLMPAPPQGHYYQLMPMQQPQGEQGITLPVQPQPHQAMQVQQPINMQTKAPAPTSFNIGAQPSVRSIPSTPEATLKAISEIEAKIYKNR